MKQEHKRIILKAMPYLIGHLEVDVSFLSVFESKKIPSGDSTEEILVSKISILLDMVINA